MLEAGHDTESWNYWENLFSWKKSWKAYSYKKYYEEQDSHSLQFLKAYQFHLFRNTLLSINWKYCKIKKKC